MEEREFFSSENVYVSISRFVAFGQTYAMSGVTSVKATEIKPSQAGTILLAGLGLILLLIGVSGSIGAMVFGGALVALALLISNQRKPAYYVSLTISSGEVRAVKSHSREYIEGIVQALNDCIVARG